MSKPWDNIKVEPPKPPLIIGTGVWKTSSNEARIHVDRLSDYSVRLGIRDQHIASRWGDNTQDFKKSDLIDLRDFLTELINQLEG